MSVAARHNLTPVDQPEQHEPSSKTRMPQRQGAIKAPAGPKTLASVPAHTSHAISAKDDAQIHKHDHAASSRDNSRGVRSHSEESPMSRVSPPMPQSTTPSQPSKPSTEIRAGLVQKQFLVPTELLTSKSPFFASMAAAPLQPTVNSSASVVAPPALRGPLFFPELDEFAMGLFVRWLNGAPLHGPTDFHSMNHYLCLYVLARRFQIEELANRVMDTVRHYYHNEQMTAPAFRLEYIYSSTDSPCLMREFLVRTAAYRALSETEKGLSESVKGAVRGGGDLAIDFVNALLAEVKSERVDIRKGDACRWHEHNRTRRCNQSAGLEPYESA